MGTPSCTHQHWGSRVVLPYQLPTLPLGLNWKVKASLCDPMDCSLPGSSVHRILQARILMWAAMPSSRWSFQLKDRTQVSHIWGRFFTIWATGKPLRLSQLSNAVAEKAMAPHSSTLAWEIPWTEEAGRLQSMGSQRVGHDWATSINHLRLYWQEVGGNQFWNWPLRLGWDY